MYIFRTFVLFLRLLSNYGKDLHTFCISTRLSQGIKITTCKIIISSVVQNAAPCRRLRKRRAKRANFITYSLPCSPNCSRDHRGLKTIMKVKDKTSTISRVVIDVHIMVLGRLGDYHSKGVLEKND